MKSEETRVQFRHEGHKKPVTRRQFLSRGLIAGAATVCMPSLAQMLVSKQAMGQTLDCGAAVGSGKIPFLCFDLGGGANFAGSSVMVGGQGGQLDFISNEGYLRLGLPADMVPSLPGQLNTELGLVFHSDSAFLRGILARTSPTTRANINGTVICARSENDTGNNPHNPMYGINKAGAGGELVALVGTRSSDSGGRSLAPMSQIDPTVRPTKVDRPSDATGLVDTGKLVDLLNQQDAGSVMRAVERISEHKLAITQEDQTVEDLVRCGMVQSTFLVENFGNPDLLDPLADAAITGQATSIFQGTEAEDVSEFRKTASVMKLVMNGFAGAGTIEFGGYDYHDSTRGTGERKDFRAGEAMGAALEYAARIGQQLMLYVFSDGSVFCDGVLDNSVEGRGKGIWRGDNSSTASVFILVYDPAGPPQLVSPDRAQIGWFRDSGSLETGATRVSNNVTSLAEAITLNYLALHDEVGMLDAALPGHSLGSGAERDSLVAFQPIRT